LPRAASNLLVTAPILDQLAVLSDATRVRVLAVLERHELTVSELCEVLRLPQSTVSRHLKTLADGGWVTSRREATSRLYTVDAEALPESARGLWQVVRGQVGAAPAAAADARRLTRVLDARRAASQAFFAGAAREWGRLRDDLFGASTPAKAVLGLLEPEWVVADLGCGAGHVSSLVAPFVRQVIGVDAAPAMLAAAEDRVPDNVDLRQGTLEALPIGDGDVDLALLVLVLHHVPDPARALAEAARILRPGGRLIVVDMQPHDREDYRQSMGHVWLGFGDGQMLRLLQHARFDAARVVPLAPEPAAEGPPLFLAAARRRPTVTHDPQGDR
jgi:SAM-dependent methyltransferase/DNA-binding HxlR family transcriptional regulator